MVSDAGLREWRFFQGVPLMGWKLYVAKRALVNRLPFGESMRGLKRRLLGYPPDLGNLSDTLAGLRWMQDELARTERSFKDAEVLEIGSGWFPCIPIALVMAGAKRVHMTDLNRHMDQVTFSATLAFLRDRFPAEPALSGVQRVEDLPLSYHAPFNVEEIPDSSLDCVVSRTVLEHIAPEDLTSLLSRLKPKLKPGGLMVHLVDHSDHMEHRDKSISKVNFLQWTPDFHRRINGLIREGENRLRHHQYVEVFAAAGYAVQSVANRLHEPTLHSVPSLKLAAPFDQMAAADIAVLASVYVVRPTDATKNEGSSAR